MNVVDALLRKEDATNLLRATADVPAWKTCAPENAKVISTRKELNYSSFILTRLFDPGINSEILQLERSIIRNGNVVVVAVEAECLIHLSRPEGCAIDKCRVVSIPANIIGIAITRPPRHHSSRRRRARRIHTSALNLEVVWIFVGVVIGDADGRGSHTRG